MPGKQSMSMPIYNTEISNVQIQHQCSTAPMFTSTINLALVILTSAWGRTSPLFLIYTRGVTVRIFKKSLVICCLQKKFGYVLYRRLKLFFVVCMLGPVLWTYCNFIFEVFYGIFWVCIQNLEYSVGIAFGKKNYPAKNFSDRTFLIYQHIHSFQTLHTIMYIAPWGSTGLSPGTLLILL